MNTEPNLCRQVNDPERSQNETLHSLPRADCLHTSEDFPLKHLSLTGPLAGETFCGLLPSQVQQREDQAMHLPLITGDALVDFVGEHVTCTDCKKAFTEVWNE